MDRRAKRGAMSNGSVLPHCLCSRALPLDIAPRFARFALRSGRTDVYVKKEEEKPRVTLGPISRDFNHE